MQRKRLPVIAIIGLTLLGVLCICLLIYLVLPKQNQAPLKDPVAQTIAAIDRQTQAAMPTRTPIPTSPPLPTQTPAPTSTPVPTPTPFYYDPNRQYEPGNPFLYQQFLERKKNLTDIQFQEYLKQITGQRMHLVGRVYEVNEEYISINPESSGLFDFDAVFLYGVPRDVLIKISKDSTIEFDATVMRFDQFIISMLRLNDPVIFTLK